MTCSVGYCPHSVLLFTSSQYSSNDFLCYHSFWFSFHVKCILSLHPLKYLMFIYSPSTSIDVCGTEPVCLHQTEILPKNPIKYCRCGSPSNLIHEFTVWIPKSDLDDHSSQCRTEKLGNITRIAWKQSDIFFFKLIPRYPISQFYPVVILIHVKSHRLIEFMEWMQ